MNYLSIVCTVYVTRHIILNLFLCVSDDIRLNPQSLSQWVEFCSTKVIHVIYRYFVPLLFMSLWEFVSFNTYTIIMIRYMYMWCQFSMSCLTLQYSSLLLCMDFYSIPHDNINIDLFICSVADNSKCVI